MNRAPDWNPALYRRFEAERTRPAADLLGRVELEAPAEIVDLGCGPANSTELLAERWPQAAVLGIDHSEAMLASARERLPRCRFALGDIATWQPDRPPDLIYANASLQWVPDHKALVPRLFSLLAPGEVLAVQVPDNRDEPSHSLMREVAADARFAAAIGDAASVRLKVLSPTAYYDLLAPQAAAVEVWRTIYQHPLDSAVAIVDWVRGTGLRPFLEPLSQTLQAAFLADYEARIAAAYPLRADGKRLLAFPRLFFVVRRRSA